jgi:alpha-tubulin suppressor-like RCC1 family protein
VGATALTGDSLEIVSGNAQAAQAEQPLTAPLVVRVRDKSSGRVVSGAVVTFSPTAGSGTVGAGTATSDGAGLVQTTWTLGSGVGEKAVTATVGGATVSFRATATPDRLELVSGGAQTARPGTALANPVVVRLFDFNNRAMAGVEVDFIPDANNGTTLPSRIVTGSDGAARTVWTIGPNPGVMRMTVRAGTAAPITVFATGGRDEIQLVSGGGQVGRVTRLLPDSIAVRVLDPAGLPAGGVTVTFAAPAGSGTPSPATVTTNAQGIARTGWVLGAVPGPMSLTANALNANPAVASAIATQDFLELVSGGDQVRSVGVALAGPIAVRLRSQAGDSLVNEVVIFSAATGSGAVTTDSVLTDLSGIARTTWTLGATAGVQTLTISGGVANPVTVRATARQPDSLAIVSGNAQVAQAGKTLAEDIVVRVNEKSSGRVVPGATVTFTVSAANGSVSETSGITDANGLARTRWTLGATTGAKSLTVSVGSPAVTRTVTATATIERLEVVSGGNQIGRRDSLLAQPIVVRVVNLAGAPVSNVMVRFKPAVGNGIVLPDSVATDGEGVARTAWTLGNVGGTQSLVVNAGAAGTLTVFATASQSRLVLESGGGQSARIQSPLPDSLVVKALTPDSLPLPNLAVTFSATSGTVSPVTVTTNAQGLAKVRWTMGNAAGTVTLTASATGVIPVSVGATALADTRRILTLEAGNLQTDTVESFLTSVIRVKVTDSLNNPIAGETILWTDSLTNGVLPVFTTSQTNALGLAETSVKLGVGVGSSLLRARLGGRSETVTATMTSQIPFAGIQTGNLFTCALTGEGRSYCWGFNGDGQLAKQSGVTANTARPTTPVTPTDSLRGPFQTFRSLSLGRTHACGISATKRLVCWGTGSGTFGATAPTGVTFTPAVTVEAVAAGEAHTCFIDIDGFAWCGGENRLGQLGNRSTTATTGNSAVGVVDGAGAVLRFSSVVSGRSFSCGFARAASLPRCWGDNGVGQLGRASVISHDSVAVTVSSAVLFDTTSLVTGLQHACALSTAGAAFCWGGNGFGQLGDASTANRNAPTAVTGGLTFVRLAAGEYHSCGLTVSGAAFCWGNNASGQLGDGTIVAKNTPTAVTLPAGVAGFRAITLGELHSCAITGVPTAVGSGTTTGTGTVYCWGDNEYGQLGNNTAAGNNAPVLTPTRVVNQP